MKGHQPLVEPNQKSSSTWFWCWSKVINLKFMPIKGHHQPTADVNQKSLLTCCWCWLKVINLLLILIKKSPSTYWWCWSNVINLLLMLSKDLQPTIDAKERSSTFCNAYQLFGKLGKLFNRILCYLKCFFFLQFKYISIPSLYKIHQQYRNGIMQTHFFGVLKT